MDGAQEFLGIGAVADRLGLSRTRIRQLEVAGHIPVSRRLIPGDRRIWQADEVEAMRRTIKARRRGAAGDGAPTAA